VGKAGYLSVISAYTFLIEKLFTGAGCLGDRRSEAQGVKHQIDPAHRS
jgi:hypothetical protein